MTELVELAAPDLRPWVPGNTGLAHAWSFTAEVPGPHVLLMALMHGNEIAGAIALDRLLTAGIRPVRGTLSLVFANPAAFARFDPADPSASRLVEEDMNRVWSAERLGTGPATVERRRARDLLPLLETADLVLDLHSMQTPSPPLMLSTMRDKGRRLAARVGMPAFVVADAGHASGTRLIDFGPFADPDDPRAAILLEAGQHWRKRTAEVAFAVTVRFLEAAGVIEAAAARRLAPEAVPDRQHFVEVTDAVTVADPSFRFERQLQGLEVVPEAGTVVAWEDGRPIVTPYPDCVLVMPSGRIKPGLTAVRLGRIVPPPDDDEGGPAM